MFEIGRLTRLELGYVGETESRSIQIDVREWLAKWPAAVIAVWVTRADKASYTAATEVEDGILTWTMTAGDTAQAGEGMAQIRALDPDETGAIYKSRVVPTRVYASLDEMYNNPDAPDPMERWANQAAIYKEEAYRARGEAQAAAAEAEQSAEAAAASEAQAERAVEGVQAYESSAQEHAENSAFYAGKAKLFATLAEQSAATHGFFYTYIDDDGHLHYVRSDGLEDLNMRIEEGRLIASYGVA